MEELQRSLSILIQSFSNFSVVLLFAGVLFRSDVRITDCPIQSSDVGSGFYSTSTSETTGAFASNPCQSVCVLQPKHVENRINAKVGRIQYFGRIINRNVKIEHPCKNAEIKDLQRKNAYDLADDN